MRETAKGFGKGDLVRVASRQSADTNSPPVVTLLTAARVTVSARRRITVLFSALLGLDHSYGSNHTSVSGKTLHRARWPIQQLAISTRCLVYCIDR